MVSWIRSIDRIKQLTHLKFGLPVPSPLKVSEELAKKGMIC